jgi:hypothetical protein
MSPGRPFVPIGGRILELLRATSFLVLVLFLSSLTLAFHVGAAELTYPQVLRTRYEAVDPKLGGSFIIWLDREKVWHGLDPRLYPPVKYVEVTHITPAPGSPPITIIEVTSINSITPEFYQVAGNVRLKVTRMHLKSTNMP